MKVTMARSTDEHCVWDPESLYNRVPRNLAHSRARSLDRGAFSCWSRLTGHRSTLGRDSQIYGGRRGLLSFGRSSIPHRGPQGPSGTESGLGVFRGFGVVLWRVLMIGELRRA